jgi:hypothetical protein
MQAKPMSRLLLFVAVLSALSSVARPWQGIQPGASSELDVISKFGEPTRAAQAAGRKTLVYSGNQAIKGTVQAQFKLSADGQVIERIDVYPAPVITLEAVQQSYGPECAGKTPAEPCYFRKQAAGQSLRLIFLKLGLAVFFKADGRTVKSFTFLPGKDE